jgi:hypothetical protein
MLGKATALESLTLSLGDIASLAFLKTMSNLTELRVLGARLVNRDFSPILALPRLKTIELSGSFGSGFRKLERARHPRDVVIREVKVPARRDAPATPQLIAGRWTIFEDLSTLLDVENNYDVEKLVRRTMKVEARELIARVELDCEAGSFCAMAEAKGDLQRLSLIIRRLAKASARPRA